MATKKKMLMSSAGAGGAGGAGLDITDVFSTYLYNGTATNVSHQIQNGIDLAGEGGLVWIKKRDSNISNTNHYLSDTERGNFQIASNSTNAQAAGDIASYNSDGWTFNASTGLGTDYLPAQSYASWTFRKAPKFFDCVQYTGTGSFQNISHNLGSVPGMIVVKKTNGTGDWLVYHRRAHIGQTYQPLPERKYLLLNGSGSVSHGSGLMWGDTPPTDTVFSVSTDTYSNNNGDTYVAYVFAHNDGDGEFGPSGDQDIIKCGSYTGDGSTNGPEIDLGFEPQWVLIKETSATGNWQLFDSMRGMVADGSDARIAPNLNSAEDSIQSLTPTATGFKINTTSGNMNTNNSNHIYMAIRRGPLAQPESGTEVFAVKRHAGADGPQPAGITSDMLITTNSEVANTERFNFNRLTNGKVLYTSQTFAEGNYSAYLNFGTNNGVNTTGFWGNTSVPLYYHFKRAPGFFDVVAYSGNSTSGRTVSHNLGVAPEMMWIKRRDITASWCVYHSAIGATGSLDLDNSGASNAPNAGARFDDTEPTSSVFTVGNFSETNNNNNTYIAYLFATLPGVSKVGSYTGNGSSQTIDCGFTSGARFVLIKNISASNSNWFVFDTTRGIVSGNDNALYLNSTASQVTDEDCIDPHSSGFRVVNSNGYVDTNNSNQNYIFYAIA